MFWYFNLVCRCKLQELLTRLTLFNFVYTSRKFWRQTTNVGINHTSSDDCSKWSWPERCSTTTSQKEPISQRLVIYSPIWRRHTTLACVGCTLLNAYGVGSMSPRILENAANNTSTFTLLHSVRCSIANVSLRDIGPTLTTQILRIHCELVSGINSHTKTCSNSSAQNDASAPYASAAYVGVLIETSWHRSGHVKLSHPAGTPRKPWSRERMWHRFNFNTQFWGVWFKLPLAFVFLLARFSSRCIPHCVVSEFGYS